MNPSNNKADGVGFGIDQVNPLRNFLAKVQEHLDPDSFIELQNRLQDKLSRKALSRVDAIDDPTQRKATFFKELEKNFDIILTIRILKAATKQMQLTLTEEWTQYIADLCDEHLQLYQEHIHSCEALGLKVNENFVGREKYLTDILKDFRDPQPSTIAGVMISGMYGMGKTSLASHICWKLAPTHNIIKINFKNKRTPKEFYWAVLGAFGEPIEGEINTVLLQKIITSCNQETILYLDDLDDLMNTTRAGYSVSYFRQVCNMLRAIAEVNPRKVKMLLTSRFKMVPAEEDQVLVQNYRTERLQGTFREYQLNPMELEECLELIDKEAKSLGKRPEGTSK